jgi:Family of unknown function (DUF6134)
MSGRAEVIDRRGVLVGTLACGVAAACGVVGARQARAMGTSPSGVSSLPVPASRSMAFRLIRHGSAIGTHTLDFSIEGNTLTVRIAVDVVYMFGPIPLVRYTHRNIEVWQGGILASLDAQTNKNGNLLHMSGHRTPAGLQVEGTNAARYIAPEDAMPTTYWNARMLQAPMIGTQDGMLVHPRVTEKPIEPVRLASGAEAAARCYNLSGDLDLDLWYSPDRSWMSMRFGIADGSVITYERL